jgi:hypothetical protein
MLKHNLNSKLSTGSHSKGNIKNQIKLEATPFLGNAFTLVQGKLNEEIIFEAIIDPAKWKNKAFIEQLVSEALGCEVLKVKFLKYGY